MHLRSCGDENNTDDADESCKPILPQSGMQRKRTGGARQHCQSWTPASTVSVQDLRENVQCKGGHDVCRSAQTDRIDRDRGHLVGIWVSSASDCACLWLGWTDGGKLAG